MKVLEGVRVLEVAQWAFVPSAGAVLADWGATVLKVEHPVHGDNMRGLLTSALVGGDDEVPINFMWELPNRGKRSLGIDLSTDDGRALVLKLAASCDVFLTSFLPAARRKLGIDLDDIKAVNPSIVYARGSGQGPLGDEAEKGGYDAATFWARGGVAMATTAPGAKAPAGPPGAGYGDLTSGMTLAGGIAAALFHRERTGEATTVDVSLLGMAMWAMAPGITAAGVYGPSPVVPMDVPDKRRRGPSGNPLVNSFSTKDRRFLTTIFLQPHRHYDELVTTMGRPDLVTDERFSDPQRRAENSVALLEELDAVFATKTLAEWTEILRPIEGVWAPYQTVGELLDDVQAQQNGYLPTIDTHRGPLVWVVSPVVFGEDAPSHLPPAPELGEATELELVEQGVEWADLDRYKASGTIT